MPFARVYILSCFCLVLSISVRSQAIVPIDQLIEEKKYPEAQRLINEHIGKFIAVKNFDTLQYYVFYVGNVIRKQGDTKKAAAAVLEFLKRLRAEGAPDRDYRQCQMDAADYFGTLGNNALSYKTFEEVFNSSAALRPPDYAILAKIQNNLSTMSQRLGNLELAEKHSRRAMQYLALSPVDNEQLYSA